MAKRYRIEFRPQAKHDFESLRAFDQRRVASAINSEFTLNPNVETRHKKCLGMEPANFEYIPPLWELRVAELRVFYDIDEPNLTVRILTIRPKPAHKTTAEVLNEATGS